MKNQKITSVFISVAMCVIFLVAGCKKDIVKNLDIDTSKTTGKEGSVTTSSLPTLSGKLVYHKYDCYGCSDTRIYIYNFATNSLTWVSQYWNIDYPMNAHFNEDASKIVFMGQAQGSGEWDIYIWTVGSASAPVNLTSGNGKRDEDPKFSPNGYRIAFKQNNDLKIMELNGTITNTVTSTSTIEEGMPYYSDNATQLIFAQGAGSGSDIYKINIDGTGKTAIASVSGVQEYYPIAWGPDNFLYSRWLSSTDSHDQVYMGYFNGATATSLPFNTATADYSDAFPCGTSNVILSSTKSGGSGGYDLYIANITTGDIYSLNSYNTGINSSLNELGACYR